jgi:hypothetical protein
LEALASGTTAGAVKAVSVFGQILPRLLCVLVEGKGMFADVGIFDEGSSECIDIRQLTRYRPTINRRQT